MGEVYRADDLSLDQPVALKFLPEALTHHADALARFRNEVRIARQVSHPNVCRVYDLGEMEGLYFLSMEYVDGEDLGSLLRRIGRLPADKALEIARKLCAGLAAAHEKGVLHRDLKPANVMLDARGQVLLTDFGLAGLAGEIERDEVRNGTPAYMAPEQLAGEEVTIKSDIYSLGLVLYEIFTGKLPYESATLAGLIRAQKESSPPSPTTLVRDLDPTVERVILRCLQARPALRPGSALAVAAALPGGDPLAAALAAGETPSPEMVAAAGEGDGLSMRVALPLFLGALALIAAACVMSNRTSALEMLQPEYSPDVLVQKVRDLLPRLGVAGGRPADFAYGFDWNDDLFDHFKKESKPAPQWDRFFAGKPPALQFWYRQSRSPMTGIAIHDDLLTPGVVQWDDPPPVESGMVRIVVDSYARLLYFERIPDQKESPPKDPAAPPDWNFAISAAGLDPAKLQPAEPLWNSLASSDARKAWTGIWPGTSRPLRVEAASLRNQPVFFSVIESWTQPDRTSSPESAQSFWSETILALITVAVCLGAGHSGAAQSVAESRRLAGRLAAGLIFCLRTDGAVDGAGPFRRFDRNVRNLPARAVHLGILRSRHLDAVHRARALRAPALAADADRLVERPDRQAARPGGGARRFDRRVLRNGHAFPQRPGGSVDPPPGAGISGARGHRHAAGSAQHPGVLPEHPAARNSRSAAVLLPDFSVPGPAAQPVAGRGRLRAAVRFAELSFPESPGPERHREFCAARRIRVRSAAVGAA